MSVKPARKPAFKRLLLRTVAVLLFLLIVAVALAPTIASRLAPGIVERAAAGGLKGSVKVQSVGLSWTGDMVVGPVELFDDAGDRVGRLTARLPVSVWRVISERWWSRRTFDLGTLTISDASLDIVRRADGTLNLQRAVAPRNPAPPAPAGGPLPFDSVKAAIAIDSLDASFKDLADPAAIGYELKGLKGQVSANVASAAGAMDINSTIALDGAVSQSGVPASTPAAVSIKADAAASIAADGALKTATVTADASGLPLGIADTLAGLNGKLVASLGQSAQFKLEAARNADGARLKGRLTAGPLVADIAAEAALDASGAPVPGSPISATADIRSVPVGLADDILGFGGTLVESLGSSADAKLTYRGNTRDGAGQLLLLAGDAPDPASPFAPAAAGGARVSIDAVLKDSVLETSGNVLLRNTRFMAGAPSLRQSLESAGKFATVDSAPPVAVTASLSGLNLTPLLAPPPAPGGNAPLSFAAVEARAAFSIGDVRGKVSVPNVSSGTPAGAAPAGDWKPFSVSGVRAEATLSKGHGRVTMATDATLDGASAGAISVDATAQDLLEASGAFKAGMPGRFGGSAKVRGLSTALLEPIVAGLALPVSIAEDVGPTLDIEARADSAPASDAPAAAGAIPPTDLALTIESANVKGGGTFRIERNRLTSTGQGLSLTMDRSSALLSRFAASGATADAPPALSFGGAGRVLFNVRNVDADLDRLAADPLLALAALVRADVEDLSIVAGGRDPITVQRSSTSLTLAPAKAPAVNTQAELSGAGSPFSMRADIVAEGLAGGLTPLRAPATPAGSAAPGAIPSLLAVRARTNLELSQVPRSLILQNAGASPEVAGLIGSVVGDSLNLSVSTEPTADGSLIARISATGAAANLASTATVGAQSIVVSDTHAEVRAPAAALTAFLSTPEAPSSMRLRSDLGVTMRVDSLTVPVIDGLPSIAGAGAAHATVSIAEPVMIDGIAVGGQERSFGIAGLEVQADVPVGALAAPASPGAVRAGSVARAAPGAAASPLIARIHADLIDGASAKVGAIEGEASAAADLSTYTASATVSGVEVALVEALAGQRPGLLVGALGDRVAVTLRSAGAVAAAGDTDRSLEIAAEAPRLTGFNAALTLDQESVSLVRPLTGARWTPEAVWLSTILFPPAPDGTPSKVALTEWEGATLDIQKLRLSIPRAATDGGAPYGAMRPEIFDLDLTVGLPRSVFSLANKAAQAAPTGERDKNGMLRDLGEALTSVSGLVGTPAADKPNAGNARAATPAEPVIDRAALVDTRLRISSAPSSTGTGPAVAFDLAVASIEPGSPSAGAPPAAVKGRVESLFDARGNSAPDQAVVTADARLVGFPTALVDALAAQGGLITETLGPALNLTLNAKNVSGAAGAPSGHIEGEANAERVSAKFRGDVRDGAFRGTEPVRVLVTQVRPELFIMTGAILPFVGSLEKDRGDDPGVIIAEDLVAPIDGDMSKLSGVVRADLGTARFQTWNILQQALKYTGQRESGQIGRKIEPFVVRMAAGVLTYERFRLPLGEFSVDTAGSVDLVGKTMSVTTYAPFFALSDELAGQVNTGVAGRIPIIDKNTMVPFTAKGPLDNPKLKLDLELFLKELLKNITKPGEILKDPIKTLEDIFGGKKDKDKKPDGQ